VTGILRRVREHPAADGGAIAIIVAILAPVLLVFAALAVDVARWYVEAEKVQKAADAAALAGVPFLPQDVTSGRIRAQQIAAINGYTGSASGPVRVDAVQEPGRPSQMRVTISSTIPNTFGRVAGLDFTTVTRTAVADYNGPAPMGSPCNAFGNEPRPGVTSATNPITVLPTPPVNADCTSSPDFWANIQGPTTDKVQGDRYMTRSCSSGVDGCTGGTNTEFRPEGYFFVVRVTDTTTGPITIQLYDPAWIFTGANCSQIANNLPVNNINPFSPGTDSSQRYDNTNNDYCTGDYAPGSSTPTRTDTSFALRDGTDDSFNPLTSPVVPGCIAQYRGVTSVPTQAQLRQGNASYNANLAAVFHNWVPLCTIASPKKGDYYLQVRTNVAMPGGMTASQIVATGNNTVVSQTGDNTSVTGNGSNAFGIRAVSSNGRAISVAGYERMPIFANATNQSSTFNLIRVLPGAAGKVVKFSFYDAADGAANPGTIQVQRPTDATGSITATSSLQGCRGEGVVTGNLTACGVTVRSSTNNGKIQTMYVPVPADYDCNYSSTGGCWFRLNVTFPGSTVTDITTWSASIEGDPVRIVE
jgi:Flp pilus assembly protein TadG